MSKLSDMSDKQDEPALKRKLSDVSNEYVEDIEEHRRNTFGGYK